jgi:putative restriction endonuclease
MFAIASTENQWFSYLKENELHSHINFWTPTLWYTKELKEGNHVYFMIKSPIRKIGGFGEFKEYKTMPAEAAWNRFGHRNGTESKLAFINSIQKYLDKNSDKFGKRKLHNYSHQIGCIILHNCVFWEEENYIDIEGYDIKFPDQEFTIKYYNEYDPFIENGTEGESFNLVKEPKADEGYILKFKEGQKALKNKLLKAYNNTCCITGETTPELLEAAFIQPFKNAFSIHVQNGLLLRVDLYKLFCSNLLFIDHDYAIHVSKHVSNDYYSSFNGKIITLPTLPHACPSIEALELRREDFRN